MQDLDDEDSIMLYPSDISILYIAIYKECLFMLDNKTSVSNDSVRKELPTKCKRKKRKRKYRSIPYMVSGGDSEGKVIYTYPTGNSEDY